MSRPSLPMQGSLRELYSSDYWLLGVDRVRGAALLRRSERAFSSLIVLQAENARVITKLAHCMIEGMVVDMRLAPSNNDDAFEKGMRALREAISRSFRRVVVVVTSAVGELQIKRIHSSEHQTFATTRSESEAWRIASMGSTPG